MESFTQSIKQRFIIDYQGLEKLFYILSEQFTVIGPKVVKELLRYEPLKSFEELALNCVNLEKAGFYKLERAEAPFTNTRPTNSLKDWLYPQERIILEIERDRESTIISPKVPSQNYCFFDVRACDLTALTIMNRALSKDPYYQTLKTKLFILAVTCKYERETCFCLATNAGPDIKRGYDLLLTALGEKFLIEIGSKRASQIIEKLPYKREAIPKDLREKHKILRDLKERLASRFRIEKLAERLPLCLTSSEWEKVEERCFACGNCTMVCPTCFCFDIVENNTLLFKRSSRVMRWDSCFSQSFATINRYNLRESISSRYRHWILHKFYYSPLSFKRFSCVGCGRCITFCPAGIDLREEVLRVVSA
ncbi:MAG: 4Fe-4S dicluster domain-containing protein [Caldimicrobium sp.]|nr:4Fe-4S dicluster domain-containing protein [Caldimicrobium sp.]MCX7874036.1 4Fe-4S dicluster domain-containing protein [Caldimicrobium sp.]MDW8093860.1 4Fe-4S dicluster domain-containing protein [Caldimicrobium sp.]